MQAPLGVKHQCFSAATYLLHGVDKQLVNLLVAASNYYGTTVGGKKSKMQPRVSYILILYDFMWKMEWMHLSCVQWLYHP